jgi:hypothetical protein
VQRDEEESRRRGLTRWVAGLGRKEALLAWRKAAEVAQPSTSQTVRPMDWLEAQTEAQGR